MNQQPTTTRHLHLVTAATPLPAPADAPQPATFQVGRTYTMRFVGDANATVAFTVVARTANTITIEAPGVRTKRVGVRSTGLFADAAVESAGRGEPAGVLDEPAELRMDRRLAAADHDERPVVDGRRHGVHEHGEVHDAAAPARGGDAAVLAGHVALF